MQAYLALEQADQPECIVPSTGLGLLLHYHGTREHFPFMPDSTATAQWFCLKRHHQCRWYNSKTKQLLIALQCLGNRAFIQYKCWVPALHVHAKTPPFCFPPTFSQSPSSALVKISQSNSLFLWFAHWHWRPTHIPPNGLSSWKWHESAIKHFATVFVTNAPVRRAELSAIGVSARAGQSSHVEQWRGWKREELGQRLSRAGAGESRFNSAGMHHILPSWVQ